MTRITVDIDQRRMREIRRIFSQFPNEVGRLMKDAINRTATKARKLIVDRLAAVNPGLKKKNIRKAVKIGQKATRTKWTALVNVRGPGIPLINLGARVGRKTKTTEIATEKQSAWLFYNVFQKKYGDMAVFSKAYRIVRKVSQNITYKLGGRTKSLAGSGAFIATMPSGHKGIFKRREGFRNKAIVEMKGPSVAQMLERSGLLIKRIEEDAQKSLGIEVDKRVKSYLDRAIKRRRAG